MKEQLEKKINYYEGILLSRFQEQSEIDLLAQGERNSRAFLILCDYLKTWIGDYQKLKTRWSEPLEEIIVSYFTDKPSVFELLVTQKIADKINAGAPKNINDFINEIAMAIAYAHVKIKATSKMVELSSNSTSN
jgi:hypothetical protein